MSEMTPRERFKAVTQFKKPDKLPWYEIFFDETIIRWIEEGLPLKEVISKPKYALLFEGGLQLSWPAFATFDPYSFFGCSTFHTCIVPIDLAPIPRYLSDVLEENDRYEVYRAEHGVIIKVFKDRTYMMPEFLDFPVKNKKDWEKYKARLNPEDPRRYPKYWEKDQVIDFYENSKVPVTLYMGGFYTIGREIMGTVNFTTAFYKDPELIEEILDYYAEFLIETLKEVVETLKWRIDLIYWHEDMAHRHGPNISPKLFKEFMLDNYKKVTSFFRKNGINNIMVDTDGNFEVLIPLLIEGGINGFWPLEVSAGMDAIKIRKEYGNKLFLIGNIDKRALVFGKNAIEKEVNSKVPILKELGGYIPSLDHLVPPEIPYENFKHYVKILKQYL